MRKGAKRKATQKDQASEKKEVVRAKRTRVPKPVSPPDYFPDKRNLVLSLSPPIFLFVCMGLIVCMCLYNLISQNHYLLRVCMYMFVCKCAIGALICYRFEYDMFLFCLGVS